MKIKILTSKHRLDEATSRLGGDWAPKTEHGLLQEAPENIIPPAFDLLVTYAKMGGQIPARGSVPGHDPFGRHPERDEKLYDEFVADRIDKFGLSKAAWDTFAQLIVRYAGRSYTHPRNGWSVDFALNPSGVHMSFRAAFNDFLNLCWEAYYANVLGGRAPTETELNHWTENKYWYEDWLNKNFGRETQTATEWTNRARKMAADGASAQEQLVLLGQMHKSYIKTIKKFFKRNPELAGTYRDENRNEKDAQSILLQRVSEKWERWQRRIINHANGNLRKIGQYMKDNPDSYKQINALIKKHPSVPKIDRKTGDLLEKDSLYHISEFVDNALLKKQLDVCDEGWEAANAPNAEDEHDMSAPCVLHKYDDGFFWWNRKASSCTIAGEEMANCGESNLSDSTLLILKEKVTNDSMDVMDKLKGRVMVEYNAAKNTLVQILGFANSFPETKYWGKIKDLYDNLDVDDLSKHAFVHLRERGKTTQTEIDEFLEFITGGSGMKPPDEFFGGGDVDSFMSRITSRTYDLETDPNFGGRQNIRFTSTHRRNAKHYAPIRVSFTLRPIYYPFAPDTLSTEEHPSFDPRFRDNLEENTEQLKKIFEDTIKSKFGKIILAMGQDNGIVTGDAASSINRTVDTLNVFKFKVGVRNMAGGTKLGIRILVRSFINIVPEIFTDESIGGPGDTPMAGPAHDIVSRIRRVFGGDKLMLMLNDSIQEINKKLDPERWDNTTPDPGATEDSPLTVDEIAMEMGQIRRDFVDGQTMAHMIDRLERLYASLAAPHPAGGHLNIDRLSPHVANAWEDWIEDDDYWSSEWLRLRADSRQRIAAMRGQQELSLDNLYDMDDEPTVQRWSGADGRRQPSRATASRFVRNVMHDYHESGLEGVGRAYRAQINAISRNYDVQGGLGLDDQDILRYRQFMDDLAHEYYQDQFGDDITPAEANAAMQGADRPDGDPRLEATMRALVRIGGGHLTEPEIETVEELYMDLLYPQGDAGDGLKIDYIDEDLKSMFDEWIQTLNIDDPAISRADLYTRWYRMRRESQERLNPLNQFVDTTDYDDDEYAHIPLPTEITPGQPDDGPDEEERNWRPGMPTPGLRPSDHQANIDHHFPDDEDSEAERLYERGALLLRFFARNPERVNDGAVRLFQRFKNEMERNSLWDEWWSQVPNDHPIANVISGLQEDHVMVEAREIVNKILGEKKFGVDKAHLNEDNKKRKGGILPFKKEEGEFYFLLGQAPQGWWSDFRGGEEPEDGGDLKVTAAREFTEESSYDLPVSLDDAYRVEHKNAAVYLTDLAELNVEDFDINKVMKINKGHYAGTPEIVAVRWFKINSLPNIPNSRVPIIQKAIQILTGPEPNARGMETAGGDAYTPYLNENQNAKILHIFDFDDTIAFTTSHTLVTPPSGEEQAAQILSQLDQEPPGPPYALNQEGLDQMFREIGPENELRSRGFDLDFSSFKTVASSSPLNDEVASRIRTCCLIGGEDPLGDFYVLTARSMAAVPSIHKYLEDNGIDIDRDKIEGVEGGLKSVRIKQWILNRPVKPERVIFYDDSINNINDVKTLRQDKDLKDVSFELYHIEDGNIPEKPMQETIYERKVFKIRIGAK